jgi:hypothetical protein
MNLPHISSEHHWAPADFQGWEIDPAFLTHGEMRARIEELEDELEALRAAHPLPIKGGPPPEWDDWILGLPDDVFLECLGPKDHDDPHQQRLTESKPAVRAIRGYRAGGRRRATPGLALP